jgi:hypothetical protein
MPGLDQRFAANLLFYRLTFDAIDKFAENPMTEWWLTNGASRDNWSTYLDVLKANKFNLTPELIWAAYYALIHFMYVDPNPKKVHYSKLNLIVRNTGIVFMFAAVIIVAEHIWGRSAVAEYYIWGCILVIWYSIMGSLVNNGHIVIWLRTDKFENTSEKIFSTLLIPVGSFMSLIYFQKFALPDFPVLVWMKTYFAESSLNMLVVTSVTILMGYIVYFLFSYMFLDIARKELENLVYQTSQE